MPGPHSADAVPKLHPVDAAHAPHRVTMGRDHRGIALTQRQYQRRRLHAWHLVGRHEYATGEIAPGARRQDRNLQREDMLAKEVLMQTVVVVRAVLKQQRGQT